jgi:hypothetical protein
MRGFVAWPILSYCRTDSADLLSSFSPAPESGVPLVQQVMALGRVGAAQLVVPAPVLPAQHILLVLGTGMSNPS